MIRKCLLVKTVVFLVIFITGFAAVVSAASSEKRQAIRNMADETLDRLYEIHPSAKGAIESSEGYAVFSNFGIKLFVLGGGSGKGIAVNNSTDQEIFMKKADVGIGLGLGVKDYREIFIFETPDAFDRFVKQGWEFGGQVTLAATDSVNGDAFQGAIMIWPGAWLYQLTDKGLALELTGQGVRYYKDNDLN